MQLSFFYMLPSILLSGFMFPFRGMPDWTQALGTVIPVTHFLRLVRGALLKGQSLADMGPSLLAPAIFVCRVTALALARYRTPLAYFPTSSRRPGPNTPGQTTQAKQTSTT